ncbi:hypothetical protein GCK32_022617, partial [Trichostrongylus colubriformis]
MISCRRAITLYPLLIIVIASSSSNISEKLHKSIMKEFHVSALLSEYLKLRRG